MSKNKKLMIASAAVLLLVCLFAGIWFFARPAVGQGDKTVTVEVIHGDGSSKVFTYRTDAEYLGEVLLDEKLVVGDMGEYGLYITAVDGETAIFEEHGAYWCLMIDGEYAVNGADTTPIADGDCFSLVYTRG